MVFFVEIREFLNIIALRGHNHEILNILRGNIDFSILFRYFSICIGKKYFTNGKNPKISKNIEKSMSRLKNSRISWLCPRRAIILRKSRISKKNAISTFHPPNRPKYCLSIFFWPFFVLIKNLFNLVKTKNLLVKKNYFVVKKKNYFCQSQN